MRAGKTGFVHTALAISLILLLLVTTGCASPEAEPTVAPTVPPTHTLRPTPTVPATNPPRPSATPSQAVDIETEERFSGEARNVFEKGRRLSGDEDYEAAVRSFERAKRHHGRPSGTLENQIALAYDNLGMYDLAIKHYSNAIAIDGSPIDRINRASSYINARRCDMAIEDAETALAMEPESAPGVHTEVEANVILYVCHFMGGDPATALRYVDIAIQLAGEHSYPADDIAQMAVARKQILGD